MLRLIGLAFAVLALVLAIASGVVYVTGPVNDAATGSDGLAVNGVFLAMIMGLPAIVALVSLASNLPLSGPRAWALAICAALLAADGAFAIAVFRLSHDWSQSIIVYNGDGFLSARAVAWLHHLSALGWCVLFAGVAELAVCAALLVARTHRRRDTATA
jgi:hypothetical protein